MLGILTLNVVRITFHSNPSTRELQGTCASTAYASLHVKYNRRRRSDMCQPTGGIRSLETVCFTKFLTQSKKLDNHLVTPTYPFQGAFEEGSVKKGSSLTFNILVISLQCSMV